MAFRWNKAPFQFCLFFLIVYLVVGVPPPDSDIDVDSGGKDVEKENENGNEDDNTVGDKDNENNIVGSVIGDGNEVDEGSQLISISGDDLGDFIARQKLIDNAEFGPVYNDPKLGIRNPFLHTNALDEKYWYSSPVANTNIYKGCMLNIFV